MKLHKQEYMETENSFIQKQW